MRLVHVDMPPDDGGEERLRERGRRFQLARVLKVTEQMLEQANAGNWDMVEDLEAQRSLELQECFSMQDDSPSELIAEALATLIYLNEQLVQIVRYARERAAAERYDHRRAFQAASAYSEGL
ncbi:MAG: flagellar protein FliT [Gammaproteobacteria bacterium]